MVGVPKDIEGLVKEMHDVAEGFRRVTGNPDLDSMAEIIDRFYIAINDLASYVEGRFLGREPLPSEEELWGIREAEVWMLYATTWMLEAVVNYALVAFGVSYEGKYEERVSRLAEELGRRGFPAPSEFRDLAIEARKLALEATEAVNELGIRSAFKLVRDAANLSRILIRFLRVSAIR